MGIWDNVKILGEFECKDDDRKSLRLYEDNGWY